MNAIALAVATGCVGWRDSAGAGGKEPAGTVLSFLTVYYVRHYHF